MLILSILIILILGVLPALLQGSAYPVHKDFAFLARFKAPMIRIIFIAGNRILSFLPGLKFKEEGISVKDETLGNGVKGWMIKPKETWEHGRCILFIHGGGFVYKGAPYHYSYALKYAKSSGCDLFFIDYSMAYNTEYGTSNMAVSLEACNGSIIDPGEQWSFNECTGDSNLESNGYKSAHVISEGKIIDGIGGGICQASSTIYNAAIRANMEVEERHNHQWASSYVPTGLDATIDYPNLDLVLSNPTDFQMFLECRVDGNTLYASVWGVKSDYWDEIHTRNEVSDKGSKSYTVRAWRIYIKDGKEVDSEELFKSTYDLDYGVVFIEADNDTNLGGSENESSNSGSNDSQSSSGGGGNYQPSSSSQSSESIPEIETDPPSSDDSSSDIPSIPSGDEYESPDGN